MIQYEDERLGFGVRIIAGEKRGTLIRAPKGADTRPTLERVRESLFGILQYEIPEATVFDLFAGSGALGLEAVSRGAKFAVINDSAREAYLAIAANVKKLHFEDRTALYCLDYALAVRRAAAAGMKFNLVFLDPPYGAGLIPKAMAALGEADALEKGCVIAAEHRAREAVDPPPGFRLAERRNYGEAALSFFREADG
ncbi:MAG TPA: 16S rRNA (guanine(966)-N(2))-methyltransferase RsmD [Clostridia bacterium]|nr:16S rRNA (guanine(966)-N(2))-methyltransferase RsmD [Clostridia bacterium]HPK14482.1 16S rRNA (guanine(966)-N(2))-methyltransferase RsmD [Clostridia bacterium]